MMKREVRRSYLDVMADILKVAKTGANKTRIVYRSNLNFALLDEYLETMTETGLIKVQGRHIETTEKGREFLREHWRLKMLLQAA